MKNSACFFRNSDCEFFPCHKTDDMENFNCLFCYCPLYRFADCGGNPETLQNGIKDCSKCSLPHRDYDTIIERLKKCTQDAEDMREVLEELLARIDGEEFQL